MKILLDYNKKVITLQDDVKLKDFIATIQSILPDWDTWSLNTENVINYYNPAPTYVPLKVVPFNEPQIKPWWEYPTITYDTGTGGNDKNKFPQFSADPSMVGFKGQVGLEVDFWK